MVVLEQETQQEAQVVLVIDDDNPDWGRNWTDGCSFMVGRLALRQSAQIAGFGTKKFTGSTGQVTIRTNDHHKGSERTTQR